MLDFGFGIVGPLVHGVTLDPKSKIGNLKSACVSHFTRKVHALNKDLLEIRMGGERHMLDAPRDRLRAGALGLRYQAEMGAQGRRVPHVADPLLGQGRDQADPERAPDRDVVAEAARQHQLSHSIIGDLRKMLEHPDPGGDGALAELDLANVLLGEHNLLSRFRLAGSRKDELSLLATHHHAISKPGRQLLSLLHTNQAEPIIPPDIQHSGDGVNKSGAADAERRRVTDRVELDIVIKLNLVNRSKSSAHPVPDLSAL